MFDGFREAHNDLLKQAQERPPTEEEEKKRRTEFFIGLLDLMKRTSLDIAEWSGGSLIKKFISSGEMQKVWNLLGDIFRRPENFKKIWKVLLKFIDKNPSLSSAVLLCIILYILCSLAVELLRLRMQPEPPMEEEVLVPA